MENGRMTGTLKSHMNICKALQIPLPELYRNLVTFGKTVEVREARTTADAFVHDNRATSEMLTSDILSKKMMPVLISMNSGGVTHNEQTKPGTEKFVYVLEGKIEASVGEEKYTLAKGDTLYLDGSIPHFFRNGQAGESRFLCVSSPPAL
jgi:quercetin dioxygenase-like cupin family protein